MSDRTLFDALCERWLDPENDDPSEWTEEMLMERIEGLVGEGWAHAGRLAAASSLSPEDLPFDPSSFIAEIDDHLDELTADVYQRQPLAQDWARVAKIGEEAGEAIEALILWTGQNPRKPQSHEARVDLITELADVALTAIYAMQHFTKDTDSTLRQLWARLRFHHWRTVQLERKRR